MDKEQERAKNQDAVRFYAGREKDEKGKRCPDYQRKSFDKAKELTEALCDELNGGDKKAAVYGLVAGLWTNHRYLQNAAVWSLLEALGRLSIVEGTDARNESSIDACKLVKEALKERIYWEGL